jgi:cytochrome c
LTILGCNRKPEDPSPAGVYAARCARCHEVDGSSTTASKMAKEEIDLRDPVFQRYNSDERIRRIARFGNGRMQGIPGITDTELDSVVVQIRRLGAAAGDSTQ